MLLLIIFTIIGIIDCQLSANQTVEQSLVATLLNGYNKNIRPSDQVDVALAMQLKQITSIDEKNQIMTSSCYVNQWWYDGRLSWNPALYNDIQVLVIFLKNIWAPDTTILNSASGDGYLKINGDFSYVSVLYTGYVYYISPALALQTRCLMDVANYPCDSQKCSLVVTSWSTGSNKINYTIENAVIDLTDYTDNFIWKLTKADTTTAVTSDRDPFEGATSYAIVFNFYLTRKPLFYMMNSVFPCLILNIVTLLTFFMPIGNALGLGN